MLFFLHQRSTAQLDATPVPELITLLQQDNSADRKVQILLQLTLNYYFDHNEINPNLSKMYFYLQQAQQVNKEKQSTKWQNELDCYYGKYFLKIGNKNKAREYFKKVELDIINSGDLLIQIKCWHKLAGNIRALDTSGLTRNDCLQKLVDLYTKTGNTEKEIEMEKAIADTHLKQGKLDLAETELLSVLEKYKSIGFNRLHYTYNLLSSVNSFKGNYNKALFYALLTIESIHNTGDTAGIINFYCHLAIMYDELEQEDKSEENFKIAFNRLFTNPADFYHIRAAGLYTRVLIKQHKLSKAIFFFRDFVKKYPPVDSYGKASMARTLSWYYKISGDLEKYEKYNLEMISLAPSLLKNNEITQEVAYDLGNYFLEKRDFKRASVYFKHAYDEVSYINSALRRKNVCLMLFKTDSALGNYVQAIRYLNQYTRLTDSIFTVVKNRQLEEVQIQYETEKKDKDLSIKDKNIQLLTKQSQLQIANLRTERNTRNMVLICAGLLILLLAISYNRYKLKQKNNIQLEEQQKNIKEKNIYLQDLLQEKEWLVKEIHHRVKNNFHTVIGLLGTQSGYLKTEEAIGAIEKSQQRIQAMSLIHQKLYQSENMSDIDMVDYIHELANYLKDSLSTGTRILFHFRLDRIDLDVDHAVPISLILNETITNAVRYAFPENRNGNIHISFTEDADKISFLSLEITDDGVGLPGEFETISSQTMGINLMKGLTKDIDGEFTIHGIAGTSVKITFTYLRNIPNYHNITV